MDIFAPNTATSDYLMGNPDVTDFYEATLETVTGHIIDHGVVVWVVVMVTPQRMCW